MDLRNLITYIPEVRKPEEKKLSFNTKLKWTLIVLVAFFILANVSLFGLSNNALDRFEYLAIILGTDFGSIISLGVGPIVMASIILQLLTGSKILDIETTTEEGKRFYQGVQKVLILFFIVFEAMVYVLMQGLEASPGFTSILILQLILGGLAIFYMDGVVNKWGFGSGVSLFIGAGVSWRLVTSAFQFINQQGENCLADFGNTACPGKVLVLIESIINRLPIEFWSALSAVVITLIIFLMVVWAQSLKVEIPLSLSRIRGYAIKYPLQFFYASVIPVILTAALVANLQLFAGMFENAANQCLLDSCTTFQKFSTNLGFLGKFVNGQPVSGLAFWIGSTNVLDLLIRGGFRMVYLLQGLTHVLFFVFFSTLFAVLWVKTSGMDAKSMAHKVSASGLHITGFRQDQRVLESIFERYIIPLTVMGGIAIGFLASITNLLGALVSGTAILLVIMIMYQFFQNIAKHEAEMNPAMRNVFGG
ncbi:preprotein translocase subunit SecY [Candidatus Pacearchaeota archaeon]|nr:preprotein translocase subunit SecY [Candidatus Pacearchaeota archaeon]